jgi:predicted nucleic acid-binding protein
MANAVLVDSCYFIDRLRADSDPFAELASFDEEWEPVTCGMVMLEVLRGIRHEGDHARYRETFAVMACIASTGRIWESATAILRSLARRGFAIPPQNAIIAASALSIDAPVLTFDRHFLHIPRLVVVESLG